MSRFRFGLLTGLSIALAAALTGCLTVVTSSSGASVTSLTPVLRVMPLGDSLTDGNGTPGGYRIRLWDQIVNKGHFKLNFVGSLSNGPSSLGDKNHEGHNGYKIEDIRNNIDGWINAAQPDAVLLNIGDNDILQNRNPGGAPGRIRDLALRICQLRPGVHVLISTLGSPTGYEARTKIVNNGIPGVVRSLQGAGCDAVLVPIHAVMSASDLADGDHPTLAGYNKMAAVWYRALAPLLSK
jgi:lysophospholipase L1-like esterase